MTARPNAQVVIDASDELGAHPSLQRERDGSTPIRMIGGTNAVTPDMEVPSQVYSGHPPAAAGLADRLARKDF
jgi:hypothetical protein